ncbi:MAG: dTMP kinase [Planctomycetota bacterium]
MTASPIAHGRTIVPDRAPNQPTHAGDEHTLPAALARALPGRFIVFEGPDGSGKSTQLRRFVGACNASGVRPVEVREPGGTEVGERIRRALLDHLEREEMTLRCEMLLYMASRAQLCERVIAPAVARGELVVADRFVSSTMAYQGAAGGLPLDEIEAAAGIATRGVSPDAVVIFDVDEQTAAQRMNPLLRGDSLDRMEAKGLAFHRKVRAGYLEQVERFPSTHLRIDASEAEDDVWHSFVHTLTAHLTKNA